MIRSPHCWQGVVGGAVVSACMTLPAMARACWKGRRTLTRSWLPSMDMLTGSRISWIACLGVPIRPTAAVCCWGAAAIAATQNRGEA